MVVVKVGGSLYDWPGLGPALRAFVTSLAADRVLLVPGGGDFADGVRKLHGVHGLSEEQAHWLALESLRPAAGLLRTFFPDAVFDSHPAIRVRAAVTVLDAHHFCRCCAAGLPHTWEVTTDSVAAAAAAAWQADRLVLLKSVDVLPGTPWGEAAARGWVDGYFPRALAGFAGAVEAVNLRGWRQPGS